MKKGKKWLLSGDSLYTEEASDELSASFNYTKD